MLAGFAVIVASVLPLSAETVGIVVLASVFSAALIGFAYSW